MFHRSQPSDSGPGPKCPCGIGPPEANIWGFVVCYQCAAHWNAEAEAKGINGSPELKALAMAMFADEVTDPVGAKRP